MICSSRQIQPSSFSFSCKHTLSLTMASDEHVLSMVDVLEADNELEEEAAAVLGDSDDKCCTYLLGYVNRQALYACMTCRNVNQTLAGICLACSYECHEGHEFVELYTKRNFRCDCGNSKFPNMTCKLIKMKQPENVENQYNHNFTGVYCTCKRPYPDPEDEIEDEMIQCVVCEDWLHGRHLGLSSVPESDGYQEMVCQECMIKCDFLWNYTVHSIVTKVVKEEGHSSIDVTASPVEAQTLHSTEDPTGSTNGSNLSVPAHDGSAVPAESKETVTTTASETKDSVNTSQASLLSDVATTSDSTISSSSASTNIGAVKKSEADGVSSSTTPDRSSEVSDSSGDSTSRGQRLGVVVAAPITDSSVADIADTTSSSSQLTNPHEGITASSTTSTATSHHATTLPTRAQGDNNQTSSREQPASSRASTTATTVSEEDVKPCTALGAASQESGSGTSGVKRGDGEEEQDQDKGGECRLKQLSRRIVPRPKGAVFWPLGWRTKLCSCAECKAMYERLQVSFLHDSSDSVVAYEERGKGKRKRSGYDQGMEALSNMNRVQQVEMLHGYQDMKSALSDFLKSFAEQGKVVTASDIQEFYEGLTRKRQRVGSAGSVQYMCR